MTISPDNVAEKVNGVSIQEKNNPDATFFETVILYHDGIPVNENIPVVFNHLMNQRYDQAKAMMN